jgi:hypothetical protein
MTKEETCRKIEAMRKNLHHLILRYGVDDEKVLKCSKELDILICRLEKGNICINIKHF